jgi:hypothetical protein
MADRVLTDAIQFPSEIKFVAAPPCEKAVLGSESFKPVLSEYVRRSQSR